MISRFEIVDAESLRPDADRIIFCDGTGGDLFYERDDLELSHWRPNRTPPEYRAGTSTEICFRFLDHPRPGPWLVAVNNHVDMDGILSVYVLVESRHALNNRRTLIQAAEMGDFWGWGDLPAQRIFQGVARLMKRAKGRDVYEEAFRRIPSLIDGTDQEIPEIDASLEQLRLGLQLIEQGKIIRNPLGDRLTHYIIPFSVAGDDECQVDFVPKFNAAVSPEGLLWPQARAFRDPQRICLLSTERPGGWFHDLWFPGYLWADTEGLWQVPGMHYDDGMGSYQLDHPGLIEAFESLQRQETGKGRWNLGGTHLQGEFDLQSRFPLVGRHADDAGRAALSMLSPNLVAGELSGRLA